MSPYLYARKCEIMILKKPKNNNEGWERHNCGYYRLTWLAYFYLIIKLKLWNILKKLQKLHQKCINI